MKKIVSVVEVEDAGLFALLNQKVLLLCMNYFYYGTLTGVNDTCVELTDPKIVYETGKWSATAWADAQPLPCKTICVQTGAIESFMQIDR